MTALYGIYGVSGFGREVMPLAKQQLGDEDADLVFIDDASRCSTVNGHRVMTYEVFKAQEHTLKKACVAIADSKIRQELADRLAGEGVHPWTLRAANTVVLGEVTVGEGSVLCPSVTLTSNLRIGRGFHCNIYSYVAHDCEIGDFVTFAPRVSCNGNVRIEDHAYIGTGAVIKQGTPDKPLVIGRGATVGMGAVVTKDVPPGAVVVGNPARSFRKGQA